MTPGIKMFIAGNWKMNGVSQNLPELNAIGDGADKHGDGVECAICLPSTLIERAVHIAEGTALQIGGQDCHANASGAHTGDISAGMLQDAGATNVILGHSERRTDHGETDLDVFHKSKAAYAASLLAIICVGETKDERVAGSALDVVGRQLEGSISSQATAANTIIAYEPVWAIGTGLVPSVQDIEAMHQFIRDALSKRFGEQGEKMRILYGGSLKPTNAREILAISNVDGGLIGGASLKAADFLAICDAAKDL